MYFVLQVLDKYCPYNTVNTTNYLIVYYIPVILEELYPKMYLVLEVLEDYCPYKSVNSTKL